MPGRRRRNSRSRAVIVSRSGKRTLDLPQAENPRPTRIAEPVHLTAEVVIPEREWRNQERANVLAMLASRIRALRTNKRDGRLAKSVGSPETVVSNHLSAENCSYRRNSSGKASIVKTSRAGGQKSQQAPSPEYKCPRRTGLPTQSKGRPRAYDGHWSTRRVPRFPAPS